MIFISVNVYITVQLSCNACVSLAEPYYNRQLIQFAHIPVEFVVCFIRYQNCVKVITLIPQLLSILVSLYLHTMIIDFYAVSEYNFQSCTQLTHALSQYHWVKALHFPGKFHFLVKTITDSVTVGVVSLNLAFSTANRVMFHEIHLQSAAHNDITMIHDLFKIYFTSSFFN